MHKKITAWLSQRWVLIIFFLLVVLLWIMSIWPQKTQLQIVHTLGPSTQSAEVLWIKQEIFTRMASNGSRVVYAMPITRDSLMAIDINNGSTLWKIELPLERGGGARDLLVDQNAVFVATSIFIDKYETTTGKLKWSTKLGDGHVSVITQIDAGVLRVYYGDELLELDSETGKILTSVAKHATIWMTDNVILKTSPNNHVIALNKQSGETLWTNNRLFYIDEDQKPLNIGNNKLLVGFGKGVCVINLQTGEYGWCNPEINISRVVVDSQSELGYAMREDLVLLTINLQTGNILGETSFLSSEPVDDQIGTVSAITFSDGVVNISFSDSNQTFGLVIK